MRNRTLPVTAFAAGLLALLTIVPTASADDARGAVDITPPAVGSCHDMTFDEAMGDVDPDPAVDCTAKHTSVTVVVVKFAKAPDWSDDGAIWKRVYGPCMRALAAMFDGHPKALQASAYAPWSYYPTKAQRDAGAKWVRCDLVVAEGHSLLQLPTDGGPTLGSLPLDDTIARCRASRTQGAYVVGCAGKHAYRATNLLRHTGSAYPGDRALKKWTERRCEAKLGGSYWMYEWPSRTTWAAGLRYSVCLKKTRS